MANAKIAAKHKGSYTVAVVSVEAYHCKGKSVSTDRRKDPRRKKVCR